MRDAQEVHRPGIIIETVVVEECNATAAETRDHGMRFRIDFQNLRVGWDYEMLGSQVTSQGIRYYTLHTTFDWVTLNFSLCLSLHYPNFNINCHIFYLLFIDLWQLLVSPN